MRFFPEKISYRFQGNRTGRLYIVFIQIWGSGMYLPAQNTSTLIFAGKMEGLANRFNASSCWVTSLYLSSYNLFI